jgi:MoaA/NifB/PqqE/SkfB family radical SAM enzyme
VGNGRRFAYSSFTAAAVRGGLRAASIKLFAPEPGVADAISRDPGGWDQACSGVRALLATGACAVEIRAPLHRRNLAQLERYAALTRELGAQQLRVEAALDAVGLDALGAATDALDRLVERCATESVALEASPLAAATTDFRWLPRAGE